MVDHGAFAFPPIPLPLPFSLPCPPSDFTFYPLCQQSQYRVCQVLSECFGARTSHQSEANPLVSVFTPPLPLKLTVRDFFEARRCPPTYLLQTILFFISDSLTLVTIKSSETLAFSYLFSHLLIAFG